MPVYNKPHFSLSDQLALLKSRGLEVADDKAAIECLHRNGYYRLSAYWYPFRTLITALDANGNPSQTRSDQFLPGSTFEAARDLYLFDKKLKLLLLEALETCEIAVRADIALKLGAADTFAYLDPVHFRPRFAVNLNARGKTRYDEWLEKFNTAVGRSKDEFVRHHQSKYGAQEPLPIWIAIELWDFGQLSYFYSGLDTKYSVAVAKRFGVPNWRVLESWLQSLNYVRNIIAHHGRLWNSPIVIRPSPPGRGVIPAFDALLSDSTLNTRIYFICCILAHMSHAVNAQTIWPQQLKELMSSFPSIPYASKSDMGFPTDWQTHAFWQ